MDKEDLNISKAIDILNNGGVIIFPTDTGFGIGCRIDKEKAIKRVFDIKNRPEGKPFPVLVNSLDMVKNYVLPIDQEVIEKLIKPYWPGGLTIVLPCKKELVPELVRGGGDTLGVRMPHHEVTLEIINKVEVPILAPSANFSNQMPPFGEEEIDPELLKMVDYVLSGSVELKQSSTVIDCSEKPWKILRQGAVEIKI